MEEKKRKRSHSRSRNHRSRSRDRKEKKDRDRERDKERDKERKEKREAEEKIRKEKEAQEKEIQQRAQEEDKQRKEQERVAEDEAELCERDKRTVFVYHLHPKVTDPMLHEFFTKAGKVRDVRLISDKKTGKSKGFGYIEFYNPSSVVGALALQGYELLGHAVMVKVSEAEKNVIHATNAALGGMSSGSAGSTRLYVGNLHPRISEGDLKLVFGELGVVESVELPKDPDNGQSKGYAYVKYKSGEDAKKALVQLNGVELATQKIKVGLVNETGGGATSSSPMMINSGPEDRLEDESLNARGRALLMAKLQGQQVPPMGSLLSLTAPPSSSSVNVPTAPMPSTTNNAGFPSSSSPSSPFGNNNPLAALMGFPGMMGSLPPMMGGMMMPGANSVGGLPSGMNPMMMQQMMMNNSMNGMFPTAPGLIPSMMPQPHHHIHQHHQHQLSANNGGPPGPNLNCAVPGGLPPVVVPSMSMMMPPLPPPAPPVLPATPQEARPQPGLLLKNLFDPAEETEADFDEDIKEDVCEECNKYGRILHVYVEKHSAGHVYLLFDGPDGAQRTYEALNKRWFAKRMITALYIPENEYKQKFGC